MDGIVLRFPGLAQGIFNNLDDESLSKSKYMSRSISLLMNRDVFFWKRIIQKYTKNIDDFKDTWRTVMNKAGQNNLKELAFAVKHFLSIHPSRCTDNKTEGICNHRNVSYSPHQISAEAGNFQLYQFILGRSDVKNPVAKGDDLWTPLHEAAKRGYLDICRLIISTVDDKNPACGNGFTPLHTAARHGYLEVCQAIMNEVQEKNPGDNDGITPLHLAVCYGHLQVCQAIMNEIQDKNPRCNLGQTPVHIAAKRGYLEICQAIMNEVQEKNPGDNDGITPLHLAAENGHLQGDY